jgi:hypothetical protein
MAGNTPGTLFKVQSIERDGLIGEPDQSIGRLEHRIQATNFEQEC